MACFWAPNVLFSPFFGVLADTISKRNLMVCSNIGRAILLLLFFVYALSVAKVSVEALCFLAFLNGSLLCLKLPSSMAYSREITSDAELLNANATLDSIYEIGNIVGMGAAGLIIALTNLKMTFFINAVCFIAGYYCLLLLPKGISRKNGDSLKLRDHCDHFWSQMHGTFIQFLRNYYEDYRSSIEYLKSRKKLMCLYSLQVLMMLSYMTAPVLLTPFAKNVLHADVTQFSLIEVSLSLGVVLGSFMVPSLVARFTFIKILSLQLIALAVAYFIFSCNTNLFFAECLYFIIDIAISSWSIIMAQVQHETESHYQGKLLATFNSVSGLAIPLMYFFLLIPMFLVQRDCCKPPNYIGVSVKLKKAPLKKIIIRITRLKKKVYLK